jgi:hypothetical protein
LDQQRNATCAVDIALDFLADIDHSAIELPDSSSRDGDDVVTGNNSSRLGGTVGFHGLNNRTDIGVSNDDPKLPGP